MRRLLSNVDDGLHPDAHEHWGSDGFQNEEVGIADDKRGNDDEDDEKAHGGWEDDNSTYNYTREKHCPSSIAVTTKDAISPNKGSGPALHNAHP